MWKNLANAVPIDPSQVVVGLYVWLDVSWAEHPFLTSRVMVKTPHDIATIQNTDVVGRLYYYPEHSTAQPLPLQPTVAELAAEALAQKALIEAEIRAKETEKKRKLQAQRDTAARANREWEAMASATRDALLNLNRSPKVAGEQLSGLSNQVSKTIAQGEEILLHLLGDKKGQGPQFHALNVMTLCMLLGKSVGLTEGELSDLALAALAHDAGKARVPPQILKTSNRKKFEEDIYRQHVAFGVQVAQISGAFTPAAIEILGDHHEFLDGSGWPKGKKDIGRSARILALIDRYDRLCTPEPTDTEALMPSQALATMFRHESSRFDPALLSALIKLLGVYPPGTLVQLSEGSLGLVVSPGPTSLQPKVLLYCPEMPKDEAPTLELWNEPDIKITEAVKPSALPPHILSWINPQQRLSYYFSASAPKT